MANFEVKSRRVVIDNKGNDKNITETFFFENCVSWADAEEKMLSYFNNENEVVAMALSKVVEVLNNPCDEEKLERYIFRAILSSIFTDDNGDEKETKYPVLVWAKTVEEAMGIVSEHIKQGYDDITLIGITKTRIVETL